ncbi:hypothetical protein KM043_011979 [Ampulex compressa]|nr:hypothetical protein KM043_011979 [Ampulex compressa]
MMRMVTGGQTCQRTNSNCLLRRFIGNTRSVFKPKETNERGEKDDDVSSINDLTEPNNCCMSGCANCVWIEYAEKLSRILGDSNEDMQKLILEKVQDPNMRAFLTMELKCRNLIK